MKKFVPAALAFAFLLSACSASVSDTEGDAGDAMDDGTDEAMVEVEAGADL